MRCLALLSGGLDSILAIRLMQEQGLEVEAVNFKTAFTCCQDTSARAARELGVRLTVIAQEDDYFELLRNPRFGYGKGANPCVDCRIYMFERAARLLQPLDARFLVSGEVLGQRPKSQKRRDLEVIGHHAGLADLLLRPLSARLLPPTLPERSGWVDRERLGAFTGRSRKGLIELARRLGVTEIPTPSSGCSLTERGFAQKVFDLLERQPLSGRWDFELLSHGRHFRFDERTKVVVARNAGENDFLRRMHGDLQASSRALLGPANFAGPAALVIGAAEEPALEFAAGLVLRYGSAPAEPPLVRAELRSGERILAACASDAILSARTLATA